MSRPYDGPVRILTPVGMLGYGYSEPDFDAALNGGVDAICVDSGSTDPGPYMLGLGKTLVTDELYRKDLRPLLRAAAERRVPVFISSAGGSGTNAQVDHLVDLAGGLAAEAGWSLRVAVIYADIPEPVVRESLQSNHFHPNDRGRLPSPEDISSCAAIVAQMGADPFLTVLDAEEPFDVVIAGRAYDPAPHAAFALSRGVEPGIAWHMGKILECGGACAEPKGGGVLADVHRDFFDLTPMGPAQRCTPLSVAAHTLYEKTRPDLLPGPGGVTDITGSTFTETGERSTRVRGSRFLPSEVPTVKLEGASVVGYRTIFVGGVHDPILIGQIDGFLEKVVKYVGQAEPALRDGQARVDFNLYGRDGVMGALEPDRSDPREIGILGQVTAPTQELANSICTRVRVACLHMPYPGQMATAGNLALPLNPMENPIGPVAAFTIYHVIDLPDSGLFPVSYRTIGASAPEEGQ